MEPTRLRVSSTPSTRRGRSTTRGAPGRSTHGCARPHTKSCRRPWQAPRTMCAHFSWAYVQILRGCS
eukprot:scaffold1152_cov104-Isochrysis_galbana.AAC.2